MLPEPVLLLEILSASNEAESWANIWTYISIPSVTEIVAIHSTRIEAELLCRQADGSWPREPELIGPDGTLALQSVGFAAPLAAFYRTTTLAAR
jgi:Uma2 family endonuclease